MKNKFIAISALFLGFQLSASAQVVVKDAWARATVAQQKSTGMFLQIESKKDAKLISAKTDIAEMTEIHEMSMENNVMKMREVKSVTLPAGKLIELKPGSYHIMLMQLKNQVKVGDEIALTLIIETADKKQETIEVKAKARALTMKAH